MSSQPLASSRSLLQTLDDVLRGTFVQSDALAKGRVDAPVRRLVGLGVLLGSVYGVCLGAYAVFRGAEHAWLQVVASAWKVPALFVLTLVVTFPSLYVFSALQRLPLRFGATLRLVVLAIVVHVTVIASLGPVFAFFAASTNSYPFLVLLNVAMFAVGGLLGLMVLRRATNALRASPPLPEAADDTPRVTVHAAGQTRRVLVVWCLVYGFVGAQMGWLLRPFLGAPHLPFAVFRPAEDNVVIAVFGTIADLFRG